MTLRGTLVRFLPEDRIWSPNVIPIRSLAKPFLEASTDGESVPPTQVICYLYH